MKWAKQSSNKSDCNVTKLLSPGILKQIKLFWCGTGNGERGESRCVVWSLDTGYWIEYISPVNPRLIQRGRGLLLYVLRLSLAKPKIIKLTSKTDSPLVWRRVSQGPPWYSPWWWVDPQIPHSTCAVIEYNGNAIYILWYKQ